MAETAPLKTIVEEGKYLPFAKLMRLEHRQFTSRHYGQARYIMMYLHEKGKLKPFYSAYVKSFERDSTGIAALEEEAVALHDRLLHHSMTVLASGASHRMKEARARRGGPPNDAESRPPRWGLLMATGGDFYVTIDRGWS